MTLNIVQKCDNQDILINIHDAAMLIKKKIKPANVFTGGSQAYIRCSEDMEYYGAFIYLFNYLFIHFF